MTQVAQLPESHRRNCPGSWLTTYWRQPPAEPSCVSEIPAAREDGVRPYEVGRRLREAAADEAPIATAKEARPMETVHAEATDLVLADLMEGEGLFGGVRKKRR